MEKEYTASLKDLKPINNKNYAKMLKQTAWIFFLVDVQKSSWVSMWMVSFVHGKMYILLPRSIGS